MMMLYANGRGTKTMFLVKEISVTKCTNHNVGTDVDQMAAALRKRGLTDSKARVMEHSHNLSLLWMQVSQFLLDCTHNDRNHHKLNSNGSKLSI